MKLKSTPLAVLENAIREHVTKHANDDETATMIAIRIPLAKVFRDDGFARQVIRHPLRHQVYVKVLVDLFGPGQAGSVGASAPSPAPPKAAPSNGHLTVEPALN